MINKNIILDYKEKNNTTYLLILFNDHGTLKYSIGQRSNYKVKNNRIIDYWLHAEYYNINKLNEVINIFNKL